MGKLTDAPDLTELLARVEGAETSRELNEAVAITLGWRARKRTGLGLNGRTPGRNGWVSPAPPYTWKARLPNFLGPQKRRWTANALRALQAKES